MLVNREEREGKSITFHVQDLWPCSTPINPQGVAFLISYQGKGSLKIIEGVPKVQVHRESECTRKLTGGTQTLEILIKLLINFTFKQTSFVQLLSLVTSLLPACRWKRVTVSAVCGLALASGELSNNYSRKVLKRNYMLTFPSLISKVRNHDKSNSMTLWLRQKNNWS